MAKKIGKSRPMMDTLRIERDSIKIFKMDYDGYEYWSGRSAEECHERKKQIQGISEEESPFSEVVQLSNKDIDTWVIEFDEDSEPLAGLNGKKVTFREYLNVLIDLQVEFPRFFAGTES